MSAIKSGTEMVPAEPFARWLNQRLAWWEKRALIESVVKPSRGDVGSLGPMQCLLLEIGWSLDSGPRKLYRYRSLRRETTIGKSPRRGIRGIAVVKPMLECQRAIVEEALHHAGVPFSDLYPDIAAAEAVEPEPQRWCPMCDEQTTPIGGCCPWCETRVGPETGQKLAGRSFVRLEQQAA